MKGLGVGVWAFGMGSERYVSDGYKPFLPLAERVKRIGKIAGVTGLEVTYPNDVNEETLEDFKVLLAENGLTPCGMGVELVCNPEWKSGSFSSPDPAQREKALKLTCGAMDLAAELGISTVSLWLGQDGFDYVFQADYVTAWDNLVDGLRKAASHRDDINLGLEYKTSEPQMACFVNSGGKALALAQATGKPNVGVTLDLGHALNARENPAEIAAVLLSANRLFHIHLNDNYSWADDDMPVGSVHFLQYLEFFYWLNKLSYSGWMSLDLYPYREDPLDACETSVLFVEKMMEYIQKPEFMKMVEENHYSGSRSLKEIYKMVLG